MPVVVPSQDDELPPEIFRQLYVALDLAADSNPVIGITSAIAGEGRTTIAVGLARTLAEDLDTMVTLVEVDLERPSLARHFSLGDSPGLSEVLRGDWHLNDVRCLVDQNLCVIPAGDPGAAASRLLYAFPNQDLFHASKMFPGLVILDLPPIMKHSYSALAASVANAVVLVVRAGITPLEVVRDAVAQLDRPPTGVVLNGARTFLPSWWPSRGV